MHITSLPGRFGIGDLGPAAHRFVDFLEAAGLSLWQILPLGPTGGGASPYTATSTFAGNPLLISPERLREAGLVSKDDLDAAALGEGDVDFAAVRRRKTALLETAFANFEQGAFPDQQVAFDAFREEHADEWLGDYALFAALHEAHDHASWTQWAGPLRDRDPKALRQAREGHARALRKHAFWQFLFERQWDALERYAHEAGVRFFGDAPIYVAHGSADVWANQDLFMLSEAGKPTAVAGVPPDYFSETGQRWGNPLYRWDVMKERGYAWWTARLQRALGRLDLLRLDHFRGFEAYWQIPADSETALGGHWEDGPGVDFFETVEAKLGALPIVAEDLGQITDEVRALMREIEAPGMAVLAFGLADGPTSAFLPHHHQQRQVAYTGTHDNNTFAGWYADDAGPQARTFAQRSLRLPRRAAPGQAARAAVRAVFASVARRAVVPVQDVLALGSAARMNTPGEVGAQNWTWRLSPGALSGQKRTRHAARLAELTTLFDRTPGTDEPETAEEKETPEASGKGKAERKT